MYYINHHIIIKRIQMFLLQLQIFTLILASLSLGWICFLNRNVEISELHIFSIHWNNAYLHEIIMMQINCIAILCLWLNILQWAKDTLYTLSNKVMKSNQCVWCEAYQQFIKKNLSDKQLSDNTQTKSWYVNSRYFEKQILQHCDIYNDI